MNWLKYRNVLIETEMDGNRNELMKHLKNNV